MTDLRRHCDWLLRAYPAPYRRQRGVEMRETLVDVSRPGASWPPLGEALSIVAGGLRRRAGLAADQPVGELTELIAGWYLVLGVAFAGAALLLGEWAPWAGARQRPPYGFGPFSTDGVPVYALVVLAGVAWWLRRPRAARALAASAFVAAAAMVTVEHHVSFWGRPPLSFVIPLLVCVGPTVVRPPVGERRPRPDDRVTSVLAGVSAVAAVSWFAGVYIYLARRYRFGDFWTGRGIDFYRLVLGSVARWFPSVGTVVLVAAIGLLVRGRRDIAGAVTAMTVPWLLMSTMVAGSLTGSGAASGRAFSTLATAPMATLGVTAAFFALAVWLTATHPRLPTPVSD